MRLLLDVGNTRIKWALLVEGRLERPGALAHQQENLGERLVEQWNFETEPEEILICSVASESINKTLDDICITQWSLKPRFMRVVSPSSGVEAGYLQTEQLGVDRWYALLGARGLGKDACCVIDCGTAVTVDVLDAGGRHQGGWIAPGVALMQRSLNLETANIDVAALTSADSEAQVWGRDTRSGIQQGTEQMLVAFVTHAYQHACQQLGGTVNCFITGGDAQQLMQKIEFEAVYEPNLVLVGMAAEVESN